jgi:hypothetical protein
MRYILPCCLMMLVAEVANAAEVKVAEINETRVKQLIADEDSFSPSSGLVVRLRVEGDDVVGDTAYGNLQIEQAVDDLGNDLKPRESVFRFGREDDFEPIDRFRMSFGRERDEEQAEARHFMLDINLQPPPRNATRINQLKGEVQVLAGGERREISIKRIADGYGKAIDDPALNDAGLQITVLDPSKTEMIMSGGDSIVLQLKGKTDVVQEAQITNAAGDSISHGHASTGFGDEKLIAYELSQPLDDNVTMTLRLLVNQQTVTVPIDLADVELP